MLRGNDQNGKKSLYVEVSLGNVPKRCVYKLENAAPKSILTFHSGKNAFFQLPAFYPRQPWLTIVQLR